MPFSEETLNKYLHLYWDPIGIGFGENSEFDEYTSYAPGIKALLESGATSDDLRRYLVKIEIEYIGLPGDINSTNKFANWLVNSWMS